ncbi:MAG: ATP-binding protein, partial [Marinobacter sp.]
MTDDSFNSLDGGGLFPRLQQRYGLRENPLEMETPFFPDGMRHHALEALRHLCGFGDMALLLTGAPGSGKSRLLAELVRSESSRLGFHRLPAAAMTSSSALARDLKQVARSGANADDNSREAVYRFFRWSEGRVVKGQRMVLLIDDADRAPPELLRLILGGFLAADRAKAAVPVFAGEDRLVTLLGLEDSSVSIHQIHLRPLTKGEVFLYLEPRVHKAGGKVNELLSSARLARIYDLSQGSFSRLQRVTPGIWLDIVSNSLKQKPARRIDFRALRLPALALLLLAGSWWFVSQQYDETVAVEIEAVPEPEQVRKSITIGPETLEGDVPVESPSPLTEETVPLDSVSEPEPEP